MKLQTRKKYSPCYASLQAMEGDWYKEPSRSAAQIKSKQKMTNYSAHQTIQTLNYKTVHKPLQETKEKCVRCQIFTTMSSPLMSYFYEHRKLKKQMEYNPLNLNGTW